MIIFPHFRAQIENRRLRDELVAHQEELKRLKEGTQKGGFNALSMTYFRFDASV